MQFTADSGNKVAAEVASLDSYPKLSNEKGRSPAYLLWQLAWGSDGWGVQGAACGAGVAFRDHENEREVVPLLCGMWSCPVCGPRRARWFRKQLRRAVEDHGLKYFWTFTIDHQSVDVGASWRLISEAWNRFRTVMRCRYPDLEYVWVVEPQKSGHAHLHVLLNRWMDHGDVREVWRSATGGSYIVHVERVRGPDVAGYLTKYMTKGAGVQLEVDGLGVLMGRHRYGKSHSIAFKPFKNPGENWRVVLVPYKEYRHRVIRAQSVVSDHVLGVPRLRHGLYDPELWRWMEEILARSPVDPVGGSP